MKRESFTFMRVNRAQAAVRLEVAEIKRQAKEHRDWLHAVNHGQYLPPFPVGMSDQGRILVQPEPVRRKFWQL